MNTNREQRWHWGGGAPLLFREPVSIHPLAVSAGRAVLGLAGSPHESPGHTALAAAALRACERAAFGGPNTPGIWQSLHAARLEMDRLIRST